MSMHRLTFHSRLPVDRQTLFEWHCNPGAFTRLTPPWQAVRELRSPAHIRDGAVRVFELRVGPAPVRWTAVHEAVVDGVQFVDRQVSGPFASWAHLHRFDESGAGSSLTDQIDLQLPWDAVTDRLALRPVVASLARAFRFRHQRTKLDLVRHSQVRGQIRTRIVMPECADSVTCAIADFLRSGGYQVSGTADRQSGSGSCQLVWRDNGCAVNQLTHVVERLRPDCVVVVTSTPLLADLALRTLPSSTRLVVLQHARVVAHDLVRFPALVPSRFTGAWIRRMFQSWVHVDDLLAAVLFALATEGALGVYTVASPGRSNCPTLSNGQAAAQSRHESLQNAVGRLAGSTGARGSGLRDLSEVGFQYWFRALDDALRFECGRLPRLPPLVSAQVDEYKAIL